MSRKHLAYAFVCAVLYGQLLLTSFRRGWTQVETDFPNYYTAAVLTVQRQPLWNFYDWTWFQRQMNYAGTERQLGGYMSFPPFTMAPLLPLVGLEPQQAKQVWLVFTLLCLVGSVWMLARLTGFHPTEVLLLALLARNALSGNFILGQDYVFLLLILIAAAWCIIRGREVMCGVLLGLFFTIKLYTAPFALYFAVRRQWKAFWAMIGSIGLFAVMSIAVFGFSSTWHYATTVLPRAIDGSVLDPYNPGWSSMTALLRHTFVPEAELNPHPLFAAPTLFFFLRSFYILGLLGLALLAVRREPGDEARAFGWFVIVLLALSPNTSSYHFILLLVPITLLLQGASFSWSAGLLLLYVLIGNGLRPWNAWLFPRLWLLLALLAYAGWRQLSAIPRASIMSLLVILVSVSLVDAWRRSSGYNAEPPQSAAHAKIDPGSIFSSAPAVHGERFVYQAIAEGRYLIRARDTGGVRTFAFDGQALHPTIDERGGPIYFELVANRRSRICAFDRVSRRLDVVVGPELNPTEPAVAPDGSRLAFVSNGSLYVQEEGRLSILVSSHSVSGPAFFADGRRIGFAQGPPGRRSIGAISVSGGDVQPIVQGGDSFAPAFSPDGTMVAYAISETGASQVWVRNLSSGARWRVTSGACNSDAPAWRSDSRTLLFASDCGRGLGLPALYSVSIKPGL
jgi:hypothetical protein